MPDRQAREVPQVSGWMYLTPSVPPQSGVQASDVVSGQEKHCVRTGELDYSLHTTRKIGNVFYGIPHAEHVELATGEIVCPDVGANRIDAQFFTGVRRAARVYVDANRIESGTRQVEEETV